MIYTICTCCLYSILYIYQILLSHPVGSLSRICLLDPLDLLRVRCACGLRRVYETLPKELLSLSLLISLSLHAECVLSLSASTSPFISNQKSTPNCARRLVAKLNYHGRIGSEKPGRAALTTCDEC